MSRDGGSQSSQRSDRDVWKSKTHVGVSAGVRGTYQGLTATVLKQGSNQAIRFYVMNLLRNWYKGGRTSFCPARSFLCLPPLQPLCLCHKGDDPRKEMHPIVTAMFGATAGAASVFGNTPLDVVKTRMQVGNPNLGCWAVWGGISISGCFTKALLDFPVQGLEAHRYKNTVDCAFQILKHEGPQA